MPSIRAPVLRSAPRPSARILPRNTQPFINQIRLESSRGNRDDKWYEPNDGGASKTQPENKGRTGGYKLDGTSGAVNSNKTMLAIVGVTAAIAATYVYGMGKPDTAIGKDLQHDTDAVKHRTGSDRQRKGGPERSEK